MRLLVRCIIDRLPPGAAADCYDARMRRTSPSPTSISEQTPPQRWARYAPAGLWAALIFALSSMPGSSVPGRFGTLAHLIEYLVLAALIIRSLDGTRGTVVEHIVLAVSLAAAWAATDELHQAFVPLRTPDPVDWIVDTAGALVGALLLAAARGARRYRAPDAQ